MSDFKKNLPMITFLLLLAYVWYDKMYEPNAQETEEEV